MTARGLRFATIVGLSLFTVSWAKEASAYRPFDGTDAAVADPGEMEIELGPAGYLREGSEHFLVAPAVVANYGLAPQWEAVLQTQAEHGLAGVSKSPVLTETFALLKTVLREGVLQDKSGPSLATEFGVVLPEINGVSGTGGTVSGILSQRWQGLTLHLNAAATITSQQHADLFLDAIVEGPHEWPVRPLAEVFHDHGFGRVKTLSGLIGAIWQVRDTLAIDAGLRHARINSVSADEVRAGITFSFPIR